eukprot:SAG31_NODE_292_length_18283_cov_10.859859_17_plen_445_part_01
MGLLALDANDYRELGLRSIAASTTEVFHADFGVDVRFLEQALVDDVRQKIISICTENEELIKSWADTEKHWKMKYLESAVWRNPKTARPYKVPRIRLMPKIGKTDARDIAGFHVSINQPFALLDSIQLHPIVTELPVFLQDADTLTRELSELRVSKHSKFVTLDIRRLYPSIDLHLCLEAVDTYLEVWLNYQDMPDRQRRLTAEEFALDSALRRVVLLENYCSFDGRFYKFTRGFPTGIANGRELAEIYRHMIERQVLHIDYIDYTVFVRGYVDDVCLVVLCDHQIIEELIQSYRDAFAQHGLEITAEVTSTSFTMLDLLCEKGPDWQNTGKLDLSVYQKPGNAYLYIPGFSDHPIHVLRAWIKGELVRYAKRSSSFEAFDRTRRLFVSRLFTRGYSVVFLQPIFDAVLYDHRWSLLQQRLLQTNQPCDTPAVLALSLPYTQRWL